MFNLPKAPLSIVGVELTPQGANLKTLSLCPVPRHPHVASVDKIWGSSLWTKAELIRSIMGIFLWQHEPSGFLSLRAPVGECGVQPCPPELGLCKLRQKVGVREPVWSLHTNHFSHMCPKPFPLTAEDVRRFSPHSHPHSALETILLPAGPRVPRPRDDLFPATAA